MFTSVSNAVAVVVAAAVISDASSIFRWDSRKQGFEMSSCRLRTEIARVLQCNVFKYCSQSGVSLR